MAETYPNISYLQSHPPSLLMVTNHPKDSIFERFLCRDAQLHKLMEVVRVFITGHTHLRAEFASPEKCPSSFFSNFKNLLFFGSPAERNYLLKRIIKGTAFQNHIQHFTAKAHKVYRSKDLGGRQVLRTNGHPQLHANAVGLQEMDLFLSKFPSNKRKKEGLKSKTHCFDCPSLMSQPTQKVVKLLPSKLTKKYPPKLKCNEEQTPTPFFTECLDSALSHLPHRQYPQ